MWTPSGRNLRRASGRKDTQKGHAVPGHSQRRFADETPAKPQSARAANRDGSADGNPRRSRSQNTFRARARSDRQTRLDLAARAQAIAAESRAWQSVHVFHHRSHSAARCDRHSAAGLAVETRLECPRSPQARRKVALLKSEPLSTPIIFRESYCRPFLSLTS